MKFQVFFLTIFHGTLVKTDRAFLKFGMVQVILSIEISSNKWPIQSYTSIKQFLSIENPGIFLGQ